LPEKNAKSAEEHFSEVFFGSDAYAQTIRRYIKEHQTARVLDCGYGDFNVGGLIVPVCRSCAGVDVVPRLIERNGRLFDAADSVTSIVSNNRKSLNAELLTRTPAE
jgi:hypothetical protein